MCGDLWYQLPIVELYSIRRFSIKKSMISKTVYGRFLWGAFSAVHMGYEGSLGELCRLEGSGNLS
jgi:hypothetical protein